jgi:predicted Zn finger-like uncharacterized protein
MFTECPECSIGFRVTAKVLQQAGGRVRCGGCGHAFSALDHLTEELPGADLQDDAPPPESDADDLTSDEKFRETSRQLLKTLSELAGPEEVRIEDTGIEWHVVDDEEDDEEIAAAAEVTDLEEFAADIAAADDEEVLELAEDDEEIAADAAPTEAALTSGDEEPTDLAASEDAEAWNELLDDDDEDTVAGDDIPLEVEEELAAIHSELSAKEEPEPVDIDSQFELQAEAMGLEISGTHEIADDEEDIAAEDEVEDEEIAAEAEVIDVEDEETAADAAPTEDEEIAADDTFTVDAAEEDQDEVAAEEAAEEDEDEIAAAYAGTEAKEEIAAAFTPDAEMIELSIEGPDDAPGNAPEYTPADELPEPSREEMTINEQIDQELLAIADQDKDFTATIIGLENAEKMFEEDAPEVETIIMEGDVVRGAMEREREKEKRERALKRFDKAGNLIDSYMARRAVRGGRRSTDPLGYGVIAGVACLVLLLAGQVVHANRQSLSTSGLFNQTIGQVYRMLGNPVTPEWSITGWQFEATNGSVADDKDVLTIYSRIGNKSEQPLPYPLVHVSLTDRWEEIIGSRVLEPSEYLAGDLNPGQPVIPGENFTAVITIDEPSVEATGFKLNVCYRVSPGRVRCATEDFKD